MRLSFELNFFKTHLNGELLIILIMFLLNHFWIKLWCWSDCNSSFLCIDDLRFMMQQKSLFEQLLHHEHYVLEQAILSFGWWPWSWGSDVWGLWSRPTHPKNRKHLQSPQQHGHIHRTLEVGKQEQAIIYSGSQKSWWVWTSLSIFFSLFFSLHLILCFFVH